MGQGHRYLAPLNVFVHTIVFRRVWGRLELTQESLIEDVSCTAVDMEPFNFAGGEVYLVTIVRIGYFDSWFEEVILRV